MTDGILAWAKGHRDAWVVNLNALRSGVLGTSELRHGKRVNTTIETIAERRRDLAELDEVIAHRDGDSDP